MKFGELFDLYYRRHVLVKNKNHKNALYFMNRHGKRWADISVTELNRGDLQVWIDEVSADRGAQAANRAIDQMSAVINWGVKRGYCDVNPCIGVERNRRSKRKRFLLPEEVERVKLAINAEAPIFRDFFWMCLLTGQRKTNVLRMRWAQIDLSLAMWTIPESEFKNGEEHIVPLSPAALAILQRRVGHSVWVFPGMRKGQSHLKDPSNAWLRVQHRAQVFDITIHDLRRTVGSYMAIMGNDLTLIAKTLGHRDLRSTQIYAQLNLAPVRAALQAVQERWLA